MQWIGMFGWCGLGVVALTLAAAPPLHAQAGEITGEVVVRVEEEGEEVTSLPVSVFNEGKSVPAGTTGSDGSMGLDMRLADITKGTPVEVVVRTCEDEREIVLVPRGEPFPEDEDCDDVVIGVFPWGDTNILIDVGTRTVSTAGDAGVPAAAGTPDFTVDFRGGRAVPFGDLGDLQDAGVSLGVGAAYRLSDRFGIRGDVDGNMLSGAEEDLGGEVFKVPSLDAYTFSGGISVNVLPLDSGWRGHIYGGAGVTSVSFEDAEDSRTEFTGSGAIKVLKQVGTVGIGVRAKVHRIFLDEEEFGTDGWTMAQIQAVVQLSF